jgi:hypothetical protein
MLPMAGDLFYEGILSYVCMLEAVEFVQCFYHKIKICFQRSKS